VKQLLRLLPLLRPHLRWVLLGIFLAFLTVLANVGLLALSSWFITTMAIAGLAGAAINYTLPAAGVRALALLRTGGRYAERLVNHNATLKVLSQLRIWLYSRMEPLAPAGLSGYRGGDLLSRLRADVDTLDDFYVRALVPAVVAILSVAGFVLFLLLYNPWIALVDLLFLAAAGVVLPAAIAAAASRAGRGVVESASALRAALVEHTEGLGELVALLAVGEHEERIAELSARHDREQRRMNWLWATSDAALLICITMAMWTGLVVAAPFLFSGRMDGPTLAMILVFLIGSFEPVMPLTEVARRLGEMAAAAGRLFELVDAQPAVARLETVRDGGNRPEDTAGADIVIRGLRFRYELPATVPPATLPPGSWVLDGVDLDLPQGRRTALIGPTGAGKSSITNVLLRFWEYQAGSVTLAGRELRDYPGEQARALFSLAPQLPHLFHTTIWENLVLGAEAVDIDRIEAALEAAQALGVVRALPEGLDTGVGEAGRMLSAGQARRITIARALLKGSPVLILDEPTEGLDGPTAERMLRSIFTFAPERSILLITHLLFGLAEVDEIIALEKGAVRASGYPDSPAVSDYLRTRGTMLP